MIDYQIQLINFPNKKITESVTENEDGSYTIFIESSLTYERQKQAFHHALEHIIENDFYRENADIIEHYRHKKKKLTLTRNDGIHSCIKEESLLM